MSAVDTPLKGSGGFHELAHAISSPFGRISITSFIHSALPIGAMLALPLATRMCSRRWSSAMPSLFASSGLMKLSTRAERAAQIRADAPRLSSTAVSVWPCLALPE